MKKIFIRVLCLALCVLMCPICFISCGNDVVFSLGPYEIKTDHYNYLAGMYKKKLAVSLGFDGYDWESTTNSSGTSIADYVDFMYNDSFLTSVYTLLYSQLLFDVHKLSLSSDIKDTIESNVQTVIDYYGYGEKATFDQKVKSYGFDSDTLKEVYTMQMKQTVLVEYLFGENGDKLSKEELDEFYTSEYIRFQTIVINNSYKIVTEKDSEGNETTVVEALTDSEKEERNAIIDDLTNLFITPVEGYEYKIIDPTMSYEQLYALYSDDKAYPQGCYSVRPVLSSNSTQNAITAASLLKENDIARVVAKRYFQSGGTITIDGKEETVNAGDSINYGYVFVKRLALADGAYEKEENADFFGDFMSSVVSDKFAEYLTNYEENESTYSLEDHGIAADLPLSKAVANEVDYKFIYGESDSE